MAYHRWSSDGKNPAPLYIWMGSDGLHVWAPGQDDKTGLFFKDGRDTLVAEKLMLALYDHLVGNGKSMRVRAGKLTIRRAQ